MPTAQIDTQGTSIFYEDSGAPPNTARYTTFVFVHGLIFNSGTFRPMLPLAPQYGLRIITMNLRDHYGSSSYTPEELADTQSPDLDAQASAVRRYGCDVASFLVYVCKAKKISPIHVEDGKKSGGLILAPWSLSNIAPLAILGDPKTLDERHAVLSRYMRKVVVYDPPSFVYGVYPDLGLSFPMTDPDIPLEERPEVFIKWVTSDYTPPPADAWPLTAEVVQQRTINADVPEAMRDLDPIERERMIEPGVAFGSGNIMKVDLGILKINAHRCIASRDLVLPDVDILALWCDRSVFICLWGAKVLDDLIREAAGSAGEQKRKISILRVSGANHFNYHWEQPEQMLRLLAENI